MINRRGVTLMEIMIVLVILAIIAGMGIPSFTLMMEQSRMNEARVNLGIILMGQRIYRTNNAAYWSPGNIAAPVDTTINNALTTDITANFYTANANITANNGAAPQTFTATLGRAAGAAVDWRFTINQTGAISCAGTNCPCNVSVANPLGCAN